DYTMCLYTTASSHGEHTRAISGVLLYVGQTLGKDFLMHTHSPLAVIADASRLGGQLLKKILDPVIESQLCTNDDALMAALRNAPPVFMISHDWPDLTGTIERIRLQAPRTRLILLVSADNRL